MKRVLIYLIVATTLALAAVFIFVPGEYSSNQSARDSAGGFAVDALLLPNLADRVNDVQRVEIVTAGDTIIATLVKADGQWQLEQMGGYHANWPKLQALLAGLAQVRVLEVKTDKPEYYARLGVEDVAAADAESVLVRVDDSETPTAILIGHQAQGRNGQFARLPGAAASVLLDRTLDVPVEMLGWANVNIVDINAAEVAEVEIIQPDNKRVLVTKISADQIDFDLVGLPPGREIKSSWAVNSVGSALSMLQLESVRPADSVDWQKAVRMRLLTFSGLEIMADMVSMDMVSTDMISTDTVSTDMDSMDMDSVDGQYLVRLQASHPTANLVKVSNEAVGKKAVAEVAKRVEEINRRVGGWAYVIDKLRFDTMVKTQEDILLPVESQ